ncbi:MAG: hypothetical protein ABUL44_00150, partial [Flavobacterium sp.]
KEIKKVILTIDRMIKSYEGLYHLNNLIYLQASDAESLDLDFSYFKKLEDISFYWTPKTQNFFDYKSLRIIRVWKYKSKDKTLSEFSAFSNVEKLGIIQSNITSIKGIKNLDRLKELELSYDLNLEINYDDLDFTLRNIEVLEIDTCKKVGLDFIKVFPNVKKLTLVKFQDILELRPILEGLPMLEELFVGETKILETDNSYYLDYPRIKKFFFAEKKYHKLKNRDLKKD